MPRKLWLMLDFLQEALREREKKGLLRHLPTRHNNIIDFCSNDYLGLSHSEELKEAILDEIKKHSARNGSTGSRLISGNDAFIENLENKIAHFHGSEAALLFSNGYTANVGLLSCLTNRHMTLVIDELSHASIIDGARLGHAKCLKFRHNDVEDLKKKLSSDSSKKMVVVESIYSMDGDISPLKKILEVCEQLGAPLIVDEAHAVGIYGENGEGLCHLLDIHKRVFAIVAPYGKAFGVHGASILCGVLLKQYLINFSRAFIYSTAPSFLQQVSIDKSYDRIKVVTEKRNLLKRLIKYFIAQRALSSQQWKASDTHIQLLMVSDNDQAVELSSYLCQEGIRALAIRHPTVKSGDERIRFSIHSFNTRDEIDKLFTALNQWKG